MINHGTMQFLRFGRVSKVIIRSKIENISKILTFSCLSKKNFLHFRSRRFENYYKVSKIKYFQSYIFFNLQFIRFRKSENEKCLYEIMKFLRLLRNNYFVRKKRIIRTHLHLKVINLLKIPRSLLKKKKKIAS